MELKKYENKTYDTEFKRIVVTKTFVSKNKLTLNRSADEILKRLNTPDHIFDFGAEILSHYLKWSDAKSVYNEEYIKKVEKKEEKKPKHITDVYETVQDFLDYMVFAWMKARDERSLSASRSINKLGHWLWLLGRDDLVEIINDDDKYNPYGMPALIAVCKKMGIVVPVECVRFAKHKCKEE